MLPVFLGSRSLTTYFHFVAPVVQRSHCAQALSKSSPGKIEDAQNPGGNFEHLLIGPDCQHVAAALRSKIRLRAGADQTTRFHAVRDTRPNTVPPPGRYSSATEHTRFCNSQPASHLRRTCVRLTSE